MAVIAMTREMATRGKDVSAGLVEWLGLTVIHHELVEQDIAQRCGMQESEVHHLLEGKASLLERWKIDNKRLSRYTAEEILEIAAKGNVLIRGWGAAYLLRAVPHVVCVRICAPMAYREQVLMERLGTNDPSAARKEILRNDHTHSSVMRKLFGVDWRDALNYAIVLNTARVPIEECVNHIVALTESPAFQETFQSQEALMDRVVAARIRTALNRRFGTSGAAPNIDVTVSAGKATLTGGAINEQLIVEAIRVTRAVDGVKGVECKVTHIGFYPAPMG